MRGEVETMGLAVVVGVIVFACLFTIAHRRWSNAARRREAAQRRRAVAPVVAEAVSAADEPSLPDDAEEATHISGDRFWFGPGKFIEVQGFTIRDGMLYVGTGLRAIAEFGGPEPALIDPQQPVGRRSAEPVEDLGYWPSYTGLSPGQRAGYLSWLESGRRDASAPIGFVFLFFYGLERRLLFDLRGEPEAIGEARALVAETERLLTIYGQNPSFARYANQLIAVARINLLKERSYERPAPRTGSNYELPLELKIPLGEIVLDGRPLPVDWALCWLIADPETRLRTPATRCEPEFNSLFAKRYESQFGEGMKLTPNKTLLSGRFTPASASFGGRATIASTDIPDVSVLKRPVAQLRKIAERCMDDLDALSRFLGKNPDARGTTQSVAHLPVELLEAHSGETLNHMRQWIDRVLADGGAAPGAQLMSHWPCAKPDQMSKREAVEIAQVLERLGVGIEPDVRFCGSPPASTDTIALFRLAEDRTSAPSKEYTAATLLLHLAATVATADGGVSANEELHLREHLERSLRLSVPEATRLAAHLRWLLASAPGLAGLKKRIEQVSLEGRAGIARFAALVAGADGHVAPGEVKVLQRIYMMLGIEPERVYSDLHGLRSEPVAPPAREPVTIRSAGTTSREFAIPAGPKSADAKQPDGEVTLDMERVQRTIVQTAEVSSLLASIFSQSVSEPPAPAPVSAELVGSSIANLDQPHSAFLRDLAQRLAWTQNDLNALADKHGLFADGAVETLNDAAFELCDEPVLEVDDGIVVNTNALKVMLA